VHLKYNALSGKLLDTSSIDCDFNNNQAQSSEKVAAVAAAAAAMPPPAGPLEAVVPNAGSAQLDRILMLINMTALHSVRA